MNQSLVSKMKGNDVLTNKVKQLEVEKKKLITEETLDEDCENYEQAKMSVQEGPGDECASLENTIATLQGEAEVK
eukprot:Pgem_evm4s14615